MLKEFLFTNIEDEDIGNIWFQQDGVTCQIGNATVFESAELMSFDHRGAAI